MEAARRGIRAGRLASHSYVTLLGLAVQDPIDISRWVAKGLAFETLERSGRPATPLLRRP